MCTTVGETTSCVTFGGTSHLRTTPSGTFKYTENNRYTYTESVGRTETFRFFSATHNQLILHDGGPQV